jgi:L-ascorbate metabolism protein UlaG (beta-lactamase superfamily)
MRKTAQKARYATSDHCDGERFFNPYRRADRSVGEVIQWMRTRRRTPWPAVVPLIAYDPPLQRVEPGRVAITFIGHSTFLIRTASTVIITDPVFTSRGGPFGAIGPRRVRPPALAASALPPVDIVLLSHNHYDHLQPSSLRLFRDTATYVVPMGLAPMLPRRRHRMIPAPVAYLFVPNRLGEPKQIELDWWQRATAGAADITCVPAQHFSARTPWNRNKTLWCGFVVRVDGVTIYFAGDSGYSPQFREIGARFGSVDVALLPIGAYEPRWFMAPVHMNPDEAVRAHLDVRPRLSIGMHFGTFQLTDEAIDEPLRALERAREAYRVSPEEFRTLGFGETAIC